MAIFIFKQNTDGHIVYAAWDMCDIMSSNIASIIVMVLRFPVLHFLRPHFPARRYARAVYAVAVCLEDLCALSNGAMSIDLECPLTTSNHPVFYILRRISCFCNWWS